MLNTVMALWNQHPGENRQRVVKLLFTFLFISVSIFLIFLLLFTLNSPAWSSVTGQEQIQTKKEGQVGIRHHSEVATATTPASADVVAGIAPVATKIPIQTCVHTPTVVVQPRVAPPQLVIYASRKRTLKHKGSEPRPIHPQTTHLKKDRPHPRKRPHVKVVATPVPRVIIVMPSPSPAPVTPLTPSPTVTPVATVSATQTPVLAEGTVVSSGMPDIVISTTPDTSMTSTNSFANSLRKKEAMRIPVPSVSKSTKKSTTKNSDRVHDEVECSRSTTYENDSEGTIVKAKRHVGLLVGNSLLGTLLLCCFVLTIEKRGRGARKVH